MSRHPQDLKFAVTVLTLCGIWYASSSAGSILNKLILQQFPYPLTVSMSSLLGTSLYSIPLMRKYQIPNLCLPTSYLLKFILPLSIGKVVAVCLSYFSLWKVPVSYAHTVKATMPLFAVVCARVILREEQSLMVYVSLIPIISGVIIASATELSFNLAGMLSALCSTFTYALLNTIVKKVLQETGLHHVKLLSIITQIACGILFPFWLIIDVTRFWNQQDGKNSLNATVLVMLFASGIIHFIQNLCSFTLIHKLTALSYAVANATKRIIVITSSLITLKNPVTATNVFGMIMAVCGVFAYNRVKHSQKTWTGPTTPESASMLLPMSMSDASMSEANLMAQMNSSSPFPAYPTQPGPSINENYYPDPGSEKAFWRRTQQGNHAVHDGNAGGARFFINGQEEV